MSNDEKATSAEAPVEVKAARPARHLRARLFAFAALTALVAGVGYVGQQAYRAATDSFVAPIILSPDSDVVLTSKLRVNQLAVERGRAAAELEETDETLAAGQTAIGRLRGLQRTPANALAWSTTMNARQIQAGATEERMLLQQRAVLEEMSTKQNHVVEQARANLDAGLISKAEYMKELQSQHEMELALLKNQRTRHQNNLQTQQVALAQKSLSGEAPPMPEVLMREEQMVRIEVEILKLESEQRTKLAEKKLLVDKLSMLDELDSQLKTRPVFRATEKSMDVAFVPYTQMSGVERGAGVYECVWGVFHCEEVGDVAELVPGEVVLPDPWGNQARGQYAVLNLRDHESAKAKTLRVRRTGRSVPPAPDAAGERLSAK